MYTPAQATEMSHETLSEQRLGSSYANISVQVRLCYMTSKWQENFVDHMLLHVPVDT